MVMDQLDENSKSAWKPLKKSATFFLLSPGDFKLVYRRHDLYILKDFRSIIRAKK